MPYMTNHLPVSVLLFERFQLLVVLLPVVTQAPDEAKTFETRHAILVQAARCFRRGSFSRRRVGLLLHGHVLEHLLALHTLRVDPSTKFRVFLAALRNEAILREEWR